MAEKEQIKEKLPIRKPSNEERIKKNEELGYNLISEIDGREIYYNPLKFIYYIEKNDGFIPAWDSSMFTKEELLIIAKDCYNLEIR